MDQVDGLSSANLGKSLFKTTSAICQEKKLIE